MKISLEWISEFVELPPDPLTLKDGLTMLGLVVESVSEVHGNPVLELEITSNRPDCMNYLGVAREIAALTGVVVRPPEGAKRMRLRKDRIPCSIEIRDPDLCPRYVGLVMDAVTVGPSPDWMQRRLEASGIRPVNVVVDITNYVLLEIGHPLHAFDFARLAGGKIVVARALHGQSMRTLDGVERSLDEEMLLINDGQGPVAIAGVMGGLDSEISLSSTTILLEAAYFQPGSVRRTSKKLGLSTEASCRFERGTDWNAPAVAIARAAKLLQELASARIAGSLQDCRPGRLEPVRIHLARARAEGLLGVRLEDAFIESTLQKLEFKPVRRGKGRWEVTCPTYRVDMELEADLIEELARFHGYQNIPTSTAARTADGQPSPAKRYELSCRQILRGLGYSEAVNLSFADHREREQFPAGCATYIAIRNPLTEETGCLRSWLVPGLLRSARHNLNHGLDAVRIFELGRVYRRGTDGGTRESRALGVLGTGETATRNWHRSGGSYDLFHLKGVIESLLASMRSEPFAFAPGADVPWLDPALAATVLVGGKRAGVLGGLHPNIEESLKLKQRIFVAEIDFEGIWESLFGPIRFAAIPRFPTVERDLSLVLPRAATWGSIRAGIESLQISELAGTELMDVYQGENIPPDKTSMMMRFIFLDREKTLTVDRVQGFVDNIQHFLRSTFGAELRKQS